MNDDELQMETDRCIVCGGLFSIIDLTDTDKGRVCTECNDKSKNNSSDQKSEDWSKYLV